MKKSQTLEMNRRMVLRGAGGFMLGLPLLGDVMPRKASAQTATRSPFVLIVVGDNGVVQAGVSLSGAREPEMFWPTATGTLTKAGMLADKATRSTGELSDYADKLLIVRGINLPVQLDRLLALGGRRPDPHRREDHGGQHQLQSHGDLGRHRHRDGEKSSPGATRS